MFSLLDILMETIKMTSLTVMLRQINLQQVFSQLICVVQKNLSAPLQHLTMLMFMNAPSRKSVPSICSR